MWAGRSRNNTYHAVSMVMCPLLLDEHIKGDDQREDNDLRRREGGGMIMF